MDIDGRENRHGQWHGHQCARGHLVRRRLYGELRRWDGGDADGGGGHGLNFWGLEWGRGHLCRDDQPVFGADDGGANGDRHIHVSCRATDLDGRENRHGQWHGHQCARGHLVRRRLYGELRRWDGGDADGGGGHGLNFCGLEWGRGHLCRDDQPVFGADDGGANGDRHIHVSCRATDLDGRENRHGQWHGHQCARGHLVRRRLYGELRRWDGGDADGGGGTGSNFGGWSGGRGHLCRDDQPVFGADDGGANGDRHIHVSCRATDLDGRENRHGQWHGHQCARGHLVRRRLYGELRRWDGGDADGGGGHGLELLGVGVAGVGTCAGTTNPCSVPMTAARTVTATFTPNTGGNQAPVVNAGTPQTVTLPNTATLAGTVTDDGVPATPGRVTSTWSKVSGPGTVTFANASAMSTTATFSQAGAYVLRLTATDSALSRSSDLNITVNNPGVRKLSNDLNADGTADLLWRNTLNGVVVGWLMKDATVASTGMLAGLPSAWQIMGTGDVNADGQADVVLRNTTNGVVAVWLMNGLTISSVGFPGSASLSYVIKGIGDVDGNGTADIVWRDTLSGVVAIWLMNGTTIANSGFPGGVPLEWQIAGLGDVNADDKADVIWRNTTDGLVAVWLMDGLNVTSTGFPGGASLNYVIKEIGDVDGNGTADLVWEDIINHGVAVWLMNGTTVAFAGFPGGVPPGWQISGMGDVNADGQSDIILQNKTNGAVALWLMNGKDILRTAFPSGTSTDWEIQ